MLVCRLRSVFLSSFGVVSELDIQCVDRMLENSGLGECECLGMRFLQNNIESSLASVLMCCSHHITAGSSGLDRSMDRIEAKRKETDSHSFPV